MSVSSWPGMEARVATAAAGSDIVDIADRSLVSLWVVRVSRTSRKPARGSVRQCAPPGNGPSRQYMRRTCIHRGVCVVRLEWGWYHACDLDDPGAPRCVARVQATEYTPMQRGDPPEQKRRRLAAERHAWPADGQAPGLPHDANGAGGSAPGKLWPDDPSSRDENPPWDRESAHIPVPPPG